MNYGILKNGLPAERQRGLIFCEKFESEAEVIRNGGVVNGTPEIDNGAVFNGTTDYIVSQTNFMINNEFSFMCLFTPDFAKDEGVARYICDAENTARYYFYHQSNNNMAVLVSNNYHVIPYDDYKDYWIDFGENLIVSTGNSSGFKVYLNGHVIADIVIAVLLLSPSFIVVGSRNNGVTFFKGTIHAIRFFSQILTPEEVLDYYNNSVFNYEKDSVLSLPMGLAQHDLSNNRTFDVSGNNNHATFGDGVTPSTFPEKIAERHGYEFDGVDDYLLTANSVVLEAVTFASLVKFDANSLNAIMCHGETGDLFNLSVGVQSGIGTDNQINFSMFSTSWKVADSGITPQLGKLYSVVGTFDGTTLSIYVDGTLCGTNTASPDSRAFPVQIGKRFDPANPNPFAGEIYEAVVLEEALTPMQVQDLHNRMMKGVNRI